MVWPAFLLQVADWFSAHAAPTIAGFLGGLVGAEVRGRLKGRKSKEKDSQ
jgi:hypothetical protein